MAHGSIIATALNTVESHPVINLIHDILSNPPAPPQQIAQDVSAVLHNIIGNSYQPASQTMSPVVQDLTSHLTAARRSGQFVSDFSTVFTPTFSQNHPDRFR